MEKESKMYLRKNYHQEDDIKDDNSVFILLKHSNNYSIFKKIDTISLEEEILIIEKNDLENNFYTVKDFFTTAEFINDCGYYQGMNEFEKFLYQTFIILYQNEYHVLMYDTILESIILDRARYPKETFTKFENLSKTHIKIKKD